MYRANKNIIHTIRPILYVLRKCNRINGNIEIYIGIYMYGHYESNPHIKYLVLTIPICTIILSIFKHKILDLSNIL